SGSKGYHIVVPLEGSSRIGDVARFAHAVGTLLVTRDPEHLTQEFSKKDRGRRILIDTGRNGYSATFAAAYAVRARPGAPISAPGFSFGVLAACSGCWTGVRAPSSRSALSSRWPASPRQDGWPGSATT